MNENDPFRYVKAILQTKEDLDTDDYIPIFINKALALYPELIFHVNAMNENSHLDNHLQFDYYRMTVPKTKQSFSKWPKGSKDEDIKMISEWFDISFSKAKEYVKLMTKEQINEIKNNLK